MKLSVKYLSGLAIFTVFAISTGYANPNKLLFTTDVQTDMALENAGKSLCMICNSEQQGDNVQGHSSYPFSAYGNYPSKQQCTIFLADGRDDNNVDAFCQSKYLSGAPQAELDFTVTSSTTADLETANIGTLTGINFPKTGAGLANITVSYTYPGN